MGQGETAELLIAKGADVNAKSQRGRTPLHNAALSGHKKIAELLIANGADMNPKNANDKTPLDRAMLNHINADLVRKRTETAARSRVRVCEVDGVVCIQSAYVNVRVDITD